MANPERGVYRAGVLTNQPFVKQIKHWSGIVRNLSEIYFWKFQDKSIPGWFLDITGDSCPQIQSAMRTCGHEMVSQAKRFCLSLQLPGTDGAARVEPSLLELCRVASEEDEVNNQESSRNILFWNFQEKRLLTNSWPFLVIPDHKSKTRWRVSEPMRCPQSWRFVS